jgi:N-acetylglucosaminyldiphosphoundecaprenol N-acetyl-beta-D-mannosaminyltransferase
MTDFNRDVYCVLGLPFDAMTLSETLNRLRRAVADREQCFLSTPNVSFVIGCLEDSEFRLSVINSDLSVSDGMPFVWVACLLGIPIRERVAGSDVFDALRKDADHSMSVYFFGGPHGVAESACHQLNANITGMNCVGHECPGFGSITEMSNESVLARINDSGADFLIVALGANKGQAWITRNRERIAVPIISHLGAVVNFVAGTVRRAPIWMRRYGLEWLWRIKEEPGLWRRYLRDGLAFSSLLLTRVIPYFWYARCHKPDASQLANANAEWQEEEQNCTIRLRGAWTRENIEPLRDYFSRSALSRKDVRLEMKDVGYVDSAFIAVAMLLHGHQIRHGRQLLIVSPQPSVRRIIEYCCAEYLLN